MNVLLKYLEASTQRGTGKHNFKHDSLSLSVSHYYVPQPSAKFLSFESSIPPQNHNSLCFKCIVFLGHYFLPLNEHAESESLHNQGMQNLIDMLLQVVIELFKRNGYLVFYIDQKLVDQLSLPISDVIFRGVPYLAWKPLRMKMHLEQNTCFKGLSCIVGTILSNLHLSFCSWGLFTTFGNCFPPLLHLLLSYSLVPSTLS